MEIFTLTSEKRTSGQVHLFLFYRVKIGCILQKKISSSQSISIWTVLSYQIQEEMTVKGVFLGIPKRCSRPAAASTSFSDENYVMILFSEYRVACQRKSLTIFTISQFCLEPLSLIFCVVYCRFIDNSFLLTKQS